MLYLFIFFLVNHLRPSTGPRIFPKVDVEKKSRKQHLYSEVGWENSVIYHSVLGVGTFKHLWTHQRKVGLQNSILL